MKVRSSRKQFDPNDPNFRWHVFLYGFGGCGKTKWIRDFAQRDHYPVVVSTYEQDLTLDGAEIPIFTVEHPDELIAIVQQPKNVIERVLHADPNWKDYPVDTFAFDILRELQLLLFGEPKTTKDIEVFDGAITIPRTGGFGVMSEPNARDAAGVPSTKDYRLLDIRTRGLIRSIEKMPYHTIITAHAEHNFDPRTHLKLSGDAKRDKELKASATITGFPSIEGYSAKADIPALVSDFMIYMDSPDQESYYMYPKPNKNFMARTRLAEFVRPVLEWTDKNGYDVLVQEVKRGMERKTKGGTK